MKKIFVLLFAVTLILGACSTLKVTSDYDPNVNFSKFKTYNLLPWREDVSSMVNDFDRKRIVDAIKQEMELRGYTYAESNSDVSVSAYIILEQKEQTTAYSTYMGGYGYYAGFGYYGYGPGFRMGTNQTTYNTETYTVGTLIIDIFDNSTKKLIWQGIGVGTVDKNPKTRERNTPKVIAEIMKSLPGKANKK
ncbi:MAG: DUF4136 domain-containing protein [Bacteroidales bacterium]|nr:DUF4136 domain-containing protein [Bacteroidales bacterium]